MNLSRPVAAAAAILLSASVAPAHAASMATVVGYNDGVRGFIDVTVTPDVTARATPEDVHAVNGQCHFDHLFASSTTGTTTIALVGRVVAGARVLFGVDGAPDATLPIGVVLTCVAKAESGVEKESTATALGAAASLAATVELPAGAVTICIRASALFTDGRFVPIEDRCRDPEPPLLVMR